MCASAAVVRSELDVLAVGVEPKTPDVGVLWELGDGGGGSWLCCVTVAGELDTVSAVPC